MNLFNRNPQNVLRKNVHLGALVFIVGCSMYFLNSASAGTADQKMVQRTCDYYQGTQKLQCDRLSYENKETCAVEGFCDNDKQGPTMESYKAETERLHAG